jgi:DNA-binding phage protein
MLTDAELTEKLATILPLLDERQRRLVLAAEARSLGYGGITRVAHASGVSRFTIQKALDQLDEPQITTDRVRQGGGGRKSRRNQDTTLWADLEALIEPDTRGDPMSPLRWTCKSTRQLADALRQRGHQVSRNIVADLLRKADYSLQANRKTLEGSHHPDRDAQFRYINDQTKAFLAQGLPIVSVDAKKKELVGPFKNGGQTWRPKGQPELVNVYDFPDPEQGKAIPYGVYDVGRNQGWVTVGQDHDTASFAVSSLRRWWEVVGNGAYPHVPQLLICADGGGSNGYRVRLWKVELQKFANVMHLQVTVCHLPPGTSKWNKIEHRLFSYISMNWRGQPLTSHEVVVELIGGTTTRQGLHVHAEQDTGVYPTQTKISDEELAAVRLTPHPFHGEWNYTISPMT